MRVLPHLPITAILCMLFWRTHRNTNVFNYLLKWKCFFFFSDLKILLLLHRFLLYLSTWLSIMKS
jgi:hypothetical protein